MPQSEEAAPDPEAGVQAQVGPPVARLVLVRHGESTWNRDHRVQGQLDPPLSEEGHRQAGLLARRLARRSYEALYASDLARAIETAAPIASAIGLPIQPDTRLREIFLGEWEGLRVDEISSRHPSAWAAWSAEPSWDVVPGGEGAGPFQVRVEGALDSILDRHPQGNVLVVTHGGVIQVALHRVVGRPSHGLFPFRISNTSISVIERREGRLVIGRVNDIAHLEAAPPDSMGPR